MTKLNKTFWQKLQTQIWTKLNFNQKLKKNLFVRATRHLNRRQNVRWAAFCNLAMFLFNIETNFEFKKTKCVLSLILVSPCEWYWRSCDTKGLIQSVPQEFTEPSDSEFPATILNASFCGVIKMLAHIVT